MVYVIDCDVNVFIASVPVLTQLYHLGCSGIGSSAGIPRARLRARLLLSVTVRDAEDA